MKPRALVVSYRGIEYELDLVRCRRALVRRQIEGEVANMADVAKRVGVSRSTASRFFSGRRTSLSTTLRLLRMLGLAFDEVAKPVGPPDQPYQADEAGPG